MVFWIEVVDDDRLVDVVRYLEQPAA